MLTSQLLPGVPLIESPFFSNDVSSLPAQYQNAAKSMNGHGYAVIDFPDPDFDERAEAIKKSLSERYGWRNPADCEFQRAQDSWIFDENILSLARNKAILELLTALYGRPAVPFQTLNFPVGTQQGLHSDHIHFNSIPDRFMCGVWVALEDIDESNGPLFYYPGSHKWPSFQNEHIGVSYKQVDSDVPGQKFARLYEHLTAKSGIERKTFLARKGQALIWASNLLHGGSEHKDPNRTRWSQVTHYFFEGCGYTTPIQNDAYQGFIQFRNIVDLRNNLLLPNVISGEPISSDLVQRKNRMARLKEKIENSSFRSHKEIPRGFDPLTYLQRNPDVFEGEADPFEHYVYFGKKERRRWRIDDSLHTGVKASADNGIKAKLLNAFRR